MSKNVGIQLPFGWDIMIVIVGAASGAIWYYANFENKVNALEDKMEEASNCLLYTSPSPRDGLLSRMPSSA